MTESREELGGPADSSAPRPSRRGELSSALVVAGAVAVSGLLLGFVWYLVAPSLPLRKVDKGMAYISPSPEQPVAADGWFVLLGLGLGIAAAILVWMMFTRTRGPIQLVGLTLGALAAGYLAWLLAVHLPNDYAHRVNQARLNDIVDRPAQLQSTNSPVCIRGCVSVRSGELWVPAFGAVVAYALMAGWSRWPNLRPGEAPVLAEPEQPQFLDGAGPS